MGCFFTLLKKKLDQTKLKNRINRNKNLASHLSEPQRQSVSSSSLSSPASFRAEPINPVYPNIINNFHGGPISASSSSLSEAEQDAVASIAHVPQPRSQYGLTKGLFPTNPHPVPLPRPPPPHSPLKANVSSSGTSSSPLSASRTSSLRYYRYEEILAGCQNFYSSEDRCVLECVSPNNFKASFGDESSSRTVEATVIRVNPSTQDLRDFINEVNTLSSLQHPNICRLIGFHARESSEPRMLLYERLHLGGLDHLLFCSSEDHPVLLDWNSRLKIAICVAQGLAFLHDEGPFKAMYKEFSTANVQVEKDFSAKLSGYGCVGGRSFSEKAIGNMSMETFERGILTPKSNVWSFGIMLLELLTGKKNHDSRHPSEDRNIVKWSWPYLNDEFGLSMIMDPQLNGQYPIKGARMLADVAHQCLQKEPSIRPAMRTLVKNLKMIQEMNYCRVSPSLLLSSLRPEAVRPRLSVSPASPPRSNDTVVSLPLASGAPMLHASRMHTRLPRLPCGSICVVENKVVRQETKHCQESS
ncbi:hypothetical protein PIB30_006585 [Stylosanthes scabra]|uniref:Protein kinase domain-containing protein n=1 Tax=Stylosanthes scabra TaxID=79078 RepID=A0ABU6Y2E0_9FABA|nr:hypothetical protein [Stylosanthes scabra]